MKIKLRKKWVIAGGIILIIISGFFLSHGSTFEISGSPQLAQIDRHLSGLTGDECANPDRRPIAVMFASDPVTRPLSGISRADIVFEMPVTPGGVTRMMGVFQCSEPTEIGSIRSARKEFIGLASSVGAILAHWGGEKEALASLDGGIMDNIDAMKYEGTTFYRKPKVKPPHNGFTSFDLLISRAEKLDYNLKAVPVTYPHGSPDIERSLSNIADTVKVPYTSPYDVVWTYDPATQTYSRQRDGKPETDALTGETVKASVIAVVRTSASPINEFYQDVDLIGEGDATIYQKGLSAGGRWEKGPELDSKLKFTGSDGKEIEFLPGTIWVEITTQ